MKSKGGYTLVLHLTEARRLRIGKLGDFDFPPGYYLYFGSALNGLEGRVRRHLRREKKLHWHIDFLASHARVIQIWAAAGQRRWECSWAKAASGLPGSDTPAKGFGSSDCRCFSHLVHVHTWPEVEVIRGLLARVRPASWTWADGIAVK